MPMIRSLRPLPVAAALLVAGASSAAMPSYSSFELQARSHPSNGFNLPAGSSFNSGTPAINDAGTVAFRLIVVGGTGGRAGVWTGARGAGSVVHQPPVDLLASDPSINGAGDVAFEQFDFFTDGIFLYDAASGMTAQAVAPGSYSSLAAPHVDESGAIAFRAKLGAGQRFVLDDGAGQTIYVAETSLDSSSPYAFLFTPSGNGVEQIAGKARIGGTAGSQPDEIRVWNADRSSTLVAVDDDGDPRSPYTGFDNGVALNDAGAVAFVANLAAGGRGVYLGDGTSTIEIATTAHPELSVIEFFAPAVNENGLVAFRGRDAAGLDAVFVGDGTTLLRLIGEHDLLPSDLGTARVDQHDGSVTFGGGVAINGRGDVAFHCTLAPADNDQIEWGSGIYVAYADGGADVNGDGVVDVDDLVMVILAWGDPGGPADVNGDGIVNVDDLVLVILSWS